MNSMALQLTDPTPDFYRSSMATSFRLGTTSYSGMTSRKSAASPVRRPRSAAAEALAQAVYSLISFPLALVFFIVTWVVCSLGLGLAVIWVGVPLLALGLLIARFGAFLQLGLYESMLDRPMNYPGPRPRRRRRSGALGMLATIIGDAGSWRAVGYWLTKMVLAPVQFGLMVGFYGYGLGAVTYPLWRRWLPAQRASDGSWHRGSSFGTNFFIDTWPMMLAQLLIGLVVLMLAPAVVRAVNSIDGGLLRLLVAGREGRG